MYLFYNSKGFYVKHYSLRYRVYSIIKGGLIKCLIFENIE